MRYSVIGILFLILTACGGPRASVKVHFLSQAETNDGRALPMHIVPVNEVLRHKLETISAEDWFDGDEADNLTGIKKRVWRGAQEEIIQMERRDSKNDFVVVVDFAGVDNASQQKLIIGSQYYKAKDIYVVVSKDRMRIVSKDVFNDYMKGN